MYEYVETIGAIVYVQKLPKKIQRRSSLSKEVGILCFILNHVCTESHTNRMSISQGTNHSSAVASTRCYSKQTVCVFTFISNAQDQHTWSTGMYKLIETLVAI